jgi:hypothetical protein
VQQRALTIHKATDAQDGTWNKTEKTAHRIVKPSTVQSSNAILAAYVAAAYWCGLNCSPQEPRARPLAGRIGMYSAMM